MAARPCRVSKDTKPSTDLRKRTTNSVIMTRTPLRISTGGGGTDLPSYYREFGGFVISAAIDKYAYISIHESFTPGYILKFSETQTVSTIAEIRHPLIREAFQMHSVPSPVELVSITDVPAGTGLGSSGSFLVGMLHAIHANMHRPVTAETLAREAIDIEMNRLQEPVWQRHLRWAASTRRSRPRGHFGTGLIFAVPYGILCLIGGLLLHTPALGAALFAWSVANRIVEALVIGWGVTRCRDCLRQPWLYPLRDLMGFAVWATSYTSRNLTQDLVVS
jgi:hypothetical protein